MCYKSPETPLVRGRLPQQIQRGTLKSQCSERRRKNMSKVKGGETKIKLIEDDEARGEIADVYDQWKKKTGRAEMPGILKCFSARPDFLRQVVDFSDTVHFSEGHLSRRHKEMIATFVSALNHCPY